MSKQNVFRRVLGTAAVCAVVLPVATCQSPTSTNQTSTKYTLSGTITKAGISNGVYAYLKLVANGGSASSPTLYWTRSAPFSSQTASYQITGISGGTYTGYTFIDVNGDASNSASAVPDAGDYATTGGQITISANQTSDVPNQAFALQ